MTGSISVQVFRYRRGLVSESSKTFHFFARHFMRQGRIFISKYLYCKVVSKFLKLYSLRTFSVPSRKILRNCDCVSQARPIVDFGFQFIRSEEHTSELQSPSFISYAAFSLN